MNEHIQLTKHLMTTFFIPNSKNTMAEKKMK